jgi:organic radical activating enzyme
MEQESEMTQDNKDAALELAKECGIKFGVIRNGMIPINGYSVDLVDYYNAARKPLEEAVAHYKNDQVVSAEKERIMQQQLLATQEAYQRVVEALENLAKIVVTQVGADYNDVIHAAYIEGRDALANPPSLEAVERKKLEDEIAVLRLAHNSTNISIYRMITERKAKLEKMK